MKHSYLSATACPSPPCIGIVAYASTEEIDDPFKHISFGREEERYWIVGCPESASTYGSDGMTSIPCIDGLVQYPSHNFRSFRRWDAGCGGSGVWEKCFARVHVNLRIGMGVLCVKQTSNT